ESHIERRRLSVISPELYCSDSIKLFLKSFNYLPGVIITTIIDQYQFVSKLIRPHYTVDPLTKFWQRLSLVIQGYNNRYVHSIRHSHRFRFPLQDGKRQDGLF